MASCIRFYPKDITSVLGINHKTNHFEGHCNPQTLYNARISSFSTFLPLLWLSYLNLYVLFFFVYFWAQKSQALIQANSHTLHLRVSHANFLLKILSTLCLKAQRAFTINTNDFILDILLRTDKVNYYWVSNKRYDQLCVTPDKNMKMNKRYATKIPLKSVTRNKMFKLSDFV